MLLVLLLGLLILELVLNFKSIHLYFTAFEKTVASLEKAVLRSQREPEDEEVRDSVV
jgi:hypothetical protein